MSQSRTAVEQALASRYAIERELGAGAAATVYLARDLKHDRDVAVKVLDAALAAAVGEERFLNEVRVTAGLSHPNIMPLFDSGAANGILNYVMPAVEGETLRQRLARDGPLAVDEAVAITRALADAVAHAHRHGIVHRDIKPDNVLLHHGVPLLADFGVARAFQLADDAHLTAAGVSIGTPAYMSPEQAAGERNIGPASDVYALATVLYEMLAGDPPFAGTNAHAVIARIVAEPPTPLRRLRDTVPPHVDAALLRALAKTPADRFATASDFAAALSRTSTMSLRETRRPTPWLVAAAAIVLIVATGSVVTWLFGSGTDALSAQRVMVFPLVVREPVAGSSSVGEDAATMIGNVLDNTGAMRWVDGWTLLDPAQRDNPDDLTFAQTLALARSRGCAWFITGRVVAQGDSAQVFLALHDARVDSVVARSSGRGPAAHAWRTGLRALNELLPALIGDGPRVDALAEWRDREPAATASFLLGEAAFRRARIAEALNHYHAAVRTDSTFGLAAIRGAIAATWNHRAAEAETLVRVALRHPLPSHYADIAHGYRDYLAGRADSAVAAFRRALAAQPDLTIAWAMLGETYVHLLPVTGNPDSAAEAAFAMAHRYDPDAGDLLFHLIEARLRRGDTITTTPLVRQFLAAGPDSALAGEIELMDACIRNPDGVQWQQEVMRRPFPLLTSSVTLAGGAASLECAQRGFAAVLQYDTLATDEADGRRWTALVGMTTVLLARGRTADASRQIEAFAGRWGYGTSIYLLGAPFVPAWVPRAQELARADAERYGANYAGVQFATRLWELGILEAYHGDIDIAAAVARELTARAARGGMRDTLLARSATAHETLARGDTTRAMQLFGELVMSAIPGDALRWHEAQPLGGERLTLARLLHARGQHQRAIDLASAFDSAWPSIYLLYFPMSLELRADAAGALRDTRLESQYRARLARLRSGAGAISLTR